MIYGESCFDRMFRLNYEEPIKEFLKKTNSDREVGNDIEKIINDLTSNKQKYREISNA